jgi:hypothetical protein
LRKLLVLFVALSMAPVFGAPLIFFGEDLGIGEGTRLLSFPNALAAISHTSPSGALGGGGRVGFEVKIGCRFS